MCYTVSVYVSLLFTIYYYLLVMVYFITLACESVVTWYFEHKGKNYIVIILKLFISKYMEIENNFNTLMYESIRTIKYLF